MRRRRPEARHAGPPHRSSGRLQSRAQPADQPLRQHEPERRGDDERLEVHVEQADDGPRRVVRVQRRQHQVPGERRLQRDVGRLDVPDLADHDHVRVLPQEAAQRASRT